MRVKTEAPKDDATRPVPQSPKLARLTEKRIGQMLMVHQSVIRLFTLGVQARARQLHNKGVSPLCCSQKTYGLVGPADAPPTGPSGHHVGREAQETGVGRTRAVRSSCHSVGPSSLLVTDLPLGPTLPAQQRPRQPPGDLGGPARRWPEARPSPC